MVTIGGHCQPLLALLGQVVVNQPHADWCAGGVVEARGNVGVTLDALGKVDVVIVLDRKSVV